MSIREIIREMSKTSDKQAIMQLENRLSFSIAFPALLVGSVWNFYGRYIRDGRPFEEVFINSAILFILAVLFWMAMHYVEDAKHQSDIFSFIYVTVYVLIVYRLYDMIGPAVWSLSVVLLLISILQLRKKMLILITLTICLTGTHVTITKPPFELGLNYYLTQYVAFFLICIIASIVHRTLQSRFDLVSMRYDVANQSKELLRQTLISVGDGVITINNEGVIDFMNPVARSLTGWHDGAKKGRLISEVLNLEGISWKGVTVESVFKDRDIVELGMDTVLTTRDGGCCNVELTATPIREGKGKISGSVVMNLSSCCQRPVMRMRDI